MNIYGIGRAIVDYYVKGRINKEFMEQVFSQLPNKILPSPKHRPLHLEGAVFSLVLKNISNLHGYTTIKETGGTCVNILKTIAQLDRAASCTFSGTVGKNPFSPSTEMNSSCSESDSSYFQPSLSISEIDEDGVFFKKSLEDVGLQTNLKVLEGTTGRCLVLPKDSDSLQHNQLGGSYLALASPAVSSEITPEQVIFPENLHYTLVEGMELEKNWFRNCLQSVPSALIVACGTPFGAKNTATFLKEWLLQQGQARSISNFNTQDLLASPLPKKKSPKKNPSKFPLLVLANDLEARVLEQEGINFTQWSAKKAVLFVITHGCGGSSCYFHGIRLFCPATPVPEIVDATGAGDVFSGAFIQYLHSNFFGQELTPKKILATLEHSSKVASKIIQVPLCQTRIL